MQQNPSKEFFLCCFLVLYSSSSQLYHGCCFHTALHFPVNVICGIWVLIILALRCIWLSAAFGTPDHSFLHELSGFSFSSVDYSSTVSSTWSFYSSFICGGGVPGLNTWSFFSRYLLLMISSVLWLYIFFEYQRLSHLCSLSPLWMPDSHSQSYLCISICEFKRHLKLPKLNSISPKPECSW